MKELDAGQRDWVLAARVHGDRYAGSPADPDAPALVGLPQPVSHADLAALSLARAAELGLEGKRVLIDVGAHPRPLDWLLAPVAGRASLVLCQAMPDLEKIAATERATIIP